MLRSLDDVPGRMHSTPCAGHELEPERTPAVWLGRGAGRAYHRPGQRLPASVPIAPVFQRKRAHGWSSPVRPPWTESAVPYLLTIRAATPAACGEAIEVPWMQL
mgnify:CR=1 FL=1